MEKQYKNSGQCGELSKSKSAQLLPNRDNKRRAQKPILIIAKKNKDPKATSKMEKKKSTQKRKNF